MRPKADAVSSGYSHIRILVSSRNRILACSLAGVALIAEPAQAQIALDTIKVTVTRSTTPLQNTPASISVLTADQIRGARLTLGLDEALALVPGLVANNRYNFALGTRISIRGFGSRAAFGVRGVRVIADGIPLTTPDGQSNLNNIDLAAAERIEVLRGAASSLYGNAAGGVIQIRSELPARGLSFEGRAVAGNKGMAKYNARLGGGSERTRYLVSAGRASGNGFRDHSDFEQNTLNARIVHTASARARTALTLSVADAPLSHNPGSLPRDSADLKPEMAWPRNVATRAGEKSRQLQGGIEHEQHFGAATVTASAYSVTRTLDNPLPFAWITLDRIAGGARSTLQWSHFTVGFDIEAQADERGEFENVAGKRGDVARRDQTDRITSVGPFARVALALTAGLSASAGLRYDRSHFEVDDRLLGDGRDDSGARTMSAFSPSAGITYTIGPASMLFANFATAFQTPTTTEMINTPPAPGQPCCAAGFNPLDPERARSFEVGMRALWRDHTRVEAAAYDMRINDALVPFQVPQAEGREFYRNAARTRHRGVELAFSSQLSPALTVGVAYTYSHFVFIDDGQAASSNEGNRLPGVPPHHMFANAGFRTRWLFVEPEVEITSSYYGDDANSPTSINARFLLVNLRLRSRQGIAGSWLRPFGAINNIFHHRYNGSVVINAAGGRYFEPAPGRNVYLGVSIGTGTTGRGYENPWRE